MNLRELMIERIHYAVTDEVLQEFFEIAPHELMELDDESFLELYEDVSTFSEWDPRVSTMTLN